MFLVSQVDRWWCPMCGTPRWGMMLFMALFWIAVLLIAGSIILRLTRRRRSHSVNPGEEVLRDRYADGAIDRETYERMLRDLRENQ